MPGIGLEVSWDTGNGKKEELRKENERQIERRVEQCSGTFPDLWLLLSGKRGTHSRICFHPGKWKFGMGQRRLPEKRGSSFVSKNGAGLIGANPFELGPCLVPLRSRVF